MYPPAITAHALHERLREEPQLQLIDVRTDEELLDGFIPGARHIPLHQLEERVREEIPDLDATIVVYCAHGIRSAQALRAMQRLGYRALRHLESGYAQWVALDLPVAFPEPACRLASGQDRYSRQVLLEEVGTKGQQRLAQARVLLIGIGGLGSPAALYLAGAGVGTLGIVDADAVELSNLHRQIIYDTTRIGEPKVESARRRIEQTNPEVKVESYPTRFGQDSAGDILRRGWDVIVDGADNFPTRYTLNDQATRHRIPVCHGSVDRFEGRVTTFVSPDGPCYRCLFPHQPKPGSVGSCAERGVLGVLPGVIGVLQATEVLKLLLGIGALLIGRLLTYNALELAFRELRYTRDPDCPCCNQRTGGGMSS